MHAWKTDAKPNMWNLLYINLHKYFIVTWMHQSQLWAMYEGTASPKGDWKPWSKIETQPSGV